MAQKRNVRALGSRRKNPEQSFLKKKILKRKEETVQVHHLILHCSQALRKGGKMAVMVMVVIFEAQKIPPVRELGFVFSFLFLFVFLFQQCFVRLNVSPPFLMDLL